jgi:hypothetical protein
MAGGTQPGASNATSTAQILQNYQNPQGGGAQSFAAGSQPTAQNVNQLQQLLQRMAAPAQGQAGQSPAMQLGQMGMNLAQMGQRPQQAPMPQMRPTGAPAPMQGPSVPTLGGLGGAMGGAQGMTPQQLNMLLAQQPRPNGWTA